MMNQALLKIVAILVFMLLSIDAAIAQTPFSDTPNPQWRTTLGVGVSASFDSPDEACRAQHGHFNPKAIYQSPTQRSWRVYDCNWTRTGISNSVLPAYVSLRCPETPTNLALRFPGVCVNQFEERAEQDCGGCGNNGQSSAPVPMVGNPINLESGAKSMTVVDYSTSDGLFRVDRNYRNRARGFEALSGTEAFGFGPFWHGLVPGKLVAGGYRSDEAQYFANDGSYQYFTVPNSTDPNRLIFKQKNSGRLTLALLNVPSGTARAAVIQGTAAPNSELRIDFPNGDYIRYAWVAAYNTSESNRLAMPVEHSLASGYKRYFDYNAADIVPYRIRDNFGRTMTLTWADGRDSDIVGVPSDAYKFPTIREIGLPDGTKLTYGYTKLFGRDDLLTSVQHTSGTGSVLWGRTYLYEDPRNRYWLTGTLDQNGARLSTYAYNGAGMVTLSERAGGVDRYQVQHFNINNGESQRIVTNPLSHVETFRFVGGISRRQLLSQIDGAANGTVPARSRTLTYSSSLLATEIDARGTSTKFINDTLNLRPNIITEAFGTPTARTTNISWHPTLDLPVEKSRPGLKINHIYDAQGRLISRSETDTTTHSLPYPTAQQVRTTSYIWDVNGRLLSLNGPRPATALGADDITTFTYDASGNMLTMINPLGHITRFGGYDANGRPALMTDPNGIETAFTYDERGRAKTITLKHPTIAANDAVTTLDYDVEGRVVGITAPAIEKLIMDYDLAGRLKSVRAADGERIDYSHDAMSNVTAEIVKRADASVARNITRTFDALGRMLTETFGPDRTSTWEYDKNDNPVKRVSARNYSTVAAFDPLDRLISTVAPDSGTTSLAYNNLDDVTASTDAASVQTTMVRNGFGEVIQEVSPDRGTSIYYYDAAGDMTVMIDGRGQRVEFTRDIAGRLLTKTPVGRPSSEVITYTYDTAAIEGSFGVGRLATVVDASGTTRFAYDHRGNVGTKQQAVGASAAANLTYAYDQAGRITQITYPSGRQVNYARDAKGRVIDVNTRQAPGAPLVTLASSLEYEPFGSLKSATYGNSLKLVQDWGNDGRLSAKRLVRSNATSLSSLSYGYDNDDNITSITDEVDVARSTSFAFDSMDRITRIDNAGSSGIKREDQFHDKNGNRLRIERRAQPGDVAPLNTDIYTIASGTNRLASIATAAGTRALNYDARGNLTAETRPGAITVTASYDGYARLTSYVRTGEASLSFIYNGMDDRVHEVRDGNARHYVYDGAGRVLGEYGAGAADVAAEYIWLSPDAAKSNQPFGGDDGVGGYAPLAIASAPAGGATQLLWVHGNHLGVPVAYTDNTGVEVTPPAFTQIAFPGQMRTIPDLYYNRYRDYDPTTGRYIQADPIGLAGDANPYGYAGANPVNMVDPDGRRIRLAAHPVIRGVYHTKIIIAPDDPGLCGCVDSQETLGAGPSTVFALGAVLEKGRNRERDVSEPYVWYVDLPLPSGKTECQMIYALHKAFNSYQNNKPYDLFPGKEPFDENYNSNSFTHGLLNAAGYENIPAPEVNVPGWDKPLPLDGF